MFIILFICSFALSRELSILITQNSSPPSLNTKSIPFLVCSNNISAKYFNTSSPPSCPNLSFILLKLSISIYAKVAFIESLFTCAKIVEQTFAKYLLLYKEVKVSVIVNSCNWFLIIWFSFSSSILLVSLSIFLEYINAISFISSGNSLTNLE